MDQQIDKLRECDEQIPAKSKIGNKQAKISEIINGLKRRQTKPSISGGNTDVEGPPFDDSSMFEREEGEAPQDEDMEYEDER